MGDSLFPGQVLLAGAFVSRENTHDFAHVDDAAPADGHHDLGRRLAACLQCIRDQLGPGERSDLVKQRHPLGADAVYDLLQDAAFSEVPLSRDQEDASLSAGCLPNNRR